MAVTSTKDTLASTKAIPAGNGESSNMPLATNATTPTQTLKELATGLVTLEMDLADLVATGAKWHMSPYLSKSGKIALLLFIHHPDYALGVEDMGDNTLVALIDGARASEIATRKKVK